MSLTELGDLVGFTSDGPVTVALQTGGTASDTCNLPGCSASRWVGSDYCRVSHAEEHAALVTSFAAGDHYLRVAAFFAATVALSEPAMGPADECTLRGCANRRFSEPTPPHRQHAYCCRLHGSTHRRLIDRPSSLPLLCRETPGTVGLAAIRNVSDEVWSTRAGADGDVSPGGGAGSVDPLVEVNREANRLSEQQNRLLQQQIELERVSQLTKQQFAASKTKVFLTREAESAERKAKESPSTDNAEFNMRRLVVNNCSGDSTPVAAGQSPSESDASSGSATIEDSSSPVITQQWFKIVKSRLRLPNDRRIKYGVRIDVDNYLLSRTTRAEFGTNGLALELFPFALLSVLEMDALDPISHLDTLPADPRSAGPRPYVASTLAEFAGQVGVMAHWVEATLSKDLADQLIILGSALSKLVTEDEEAEWFLADARLIFGMCLDHLSAEIKSNVQMLRGLLAEASQHCDGMLPTWSRIQECALTPTPPHNLARLPDSRWPLNTVHPDCYMKRALKERLKQRRRATNLSSAKAQHELDKAQARHERTDATKAARAGGPASPATRLPSMVGSGSPVISDAAAQAAADQAARAEAAATSTKTTTAGTPAAVSVDDETKAKRAAARAGATRRRQAFRAGQRAWDAADICLVAGGSQSDLAGLMIGPMIRGTSSRASGGVILAGKRLLTDEERADLGKPENTLTWQSRELCMRSSCHDGCPFPASECRWAHCEVNKGVPPDLPNPKQLPPVVQCFAVSLGGFKTQPMVLPEKRQAALDAIRSPGGRGGAITQRDLKRTALSSVHGSTSRAGQQRVAVQTSHVPGGEEMTHRQLVETKVRVAQRESCAAEAAATAVAKHFQPEQLLEPARPNDPPSVYSMLGSSAHPLEIKGKQLVLGTDPPLWDVTPPPPVRPHGPPSAPAADAATVFNYLTTRFNTNDSLDSHFMAWSTRMIQLYLTGDITGGPQRDASLASGFDWAMQIALSRGHRTLAVRAARYVPAAKLAAATSRASGHRTPMGRPLVVMYPPQPRHNGPARVRFDVVDGSFEGFDTGSELELNGVHHDDQCVFITQSVLDLVSDGTDLTWDVVHSRSSAAARAFYSQALAVRAEAGLPSSRMTVTEAEWRHDVDDVIEMSDHDARCAVWLGRDLPPHLAFSARPWALMRLVIIVSRGVGSPARIFVINGETWGAEVDGAWTAFQMLYCLHSMPLRPVTPRWRGNRGGDVFLAEAARAGVSPALIQARSWDHLLARAGKAGPDDVMLPTDVLLRAMRDDVEASWARAGREAIRLPDHPAPRRVRFAPNKAAPVVSTPTAAKLASTSSPPIDSPAPTVAAPKDDGAAHSTARGPTGVLNVPALPSHNCRTAGCRRRAPGPFPPAVCGVAELHCCLRCYVTNGERHTLECNGPTTDLSADRPATWAGRRRARTANASPALTCRRIGRRLARGRRRHRLLLQRQPQYPLQRRRLLLLQRQPQCPLQRRRPSPSSTAVLTTTWAQLRRSSSSLRAAPSRGAAVGRAWRVRSASS